MKKAISCCLLALMLSACLVGCGGETPEAVTEQAPTVPEVTSGQAEYANPFSDTAPEGDVIVVNQAFGSDIWPMWSYYPELHLQLLSKHPLDTSVFSVTMPIKTDYRAEVQERSVLPAPSRDRREHDQSFPFYLYQIYQGMNWKELRRLEAAYSENPTSEDGKNYEKYRLMGWDGYLALTAKDLPVFYLYDIRIDFVPGMVEGKEIYDETCSQIALRLGDFDTVLEGGSFRIHAQQPPIETIGQWQGIAPGKLGPFLINCTPWNGGIEQVELLMDLDAAEELTLTDFSLFGGRLELVQLMVNISSEAGTSVDCYWDGKSPLRLKAGDHLDITAVIRDPEAVDGYDYAARSLAVMGYSCGEQAASHWAEIIFTRTASPWEIYAAWFDGLDISGYYKDYYQPCFGAWREKFEER